MTPNLRIVPAGARPVATLPAGIAALPQAGRAAVYAALVRVLHEDFDLDRAALVPSATLAGLGLMPMQWWLVHEAVLEAVPRLGTHPAFDDPAIVHRTLADIAAWRAAAARQPANARVAPVVRMFDEADAPVG